MKKLIFYLKPYIKLVVLAPILMLFEVSAELIQPLLMASIVDYGIKTGDIVYIIRTGAIMIGVVIIGALGGVGSTICASFVSQNYGADLRMDLFKNIQAFSFTNIDSFKSSSLITRLTNDVVLLQNVIQSSLRIVLRAPIFIIGGLAIAFRINARLALIMVLIVPIIGLVSVIVMRKAFPMFKKVQRGLDKVNSVIQENLAGVKVVKAFMRMEFEKKRFNKSNEELMDSMIQATRLAAIILPLMILLMNLSIVAVVWFGGVQVNLGNMQVGEVLAFINYMTQILFSLIMVAFMLMFASRAKASADRVIEILEIEPSIKDNKSHSNEKHIIHGNICFKNVYFKYENKEILTNINLNINPGETVGIIGSTGTGKTTLVNLIPRFYDVTSGEILIDGNNVKNIPLKQLRENISMVLQEPILFSGTIVENILWGRENASMDEVIDSTKMAQAHDFIEKFTEGFNTVLGQRGVNLSGGQKQRISIARALLRNPKILILDDSTSAVDMITEVKIQSALKEQLSGVTKIIIAQRVSSIIEADKIVVLEQGSIVSIGSHKELVENSAVYKEIYNSQIGEAVN